MSSIMQRMFNLLRNLFLNRTLWPAMMVAATVLIAAPVLAQEGDQWPPQKRTVGFNPETDTPVLVADQNGTVHAFSSQWLDDGEQSVKAIMYNRWTADSGWTMPVDVLLSPWKEEARIQDAYLDQSGLLHVIFFGGDETGANIYHSQAPAVYAAQAPSWSEPKVAGAWANNPDVAALSADDQGNLVVVYSGNKDGKGLYSVYSSDGGETWTEPEPDFLTYGSRFPFILDLDSDQSGLVHAVWDVRTTAGQGRQINYAQLDLGERQWRNPQTLAEVESGYGVLQPTVIEHDGEVFVAYSGVTMRRSEDGGQTWTDPVSPFRQTGVNGLMSFVVDSNDDLHLMWAQRITGSPDIHGVWHSMWHDGQWTEPEAVVSGPRVHDTVRFNSFDPYDVRSIVSQGNRLLVMWRQDPGLKGNGVWYSNLILDAPELAPVPLPVPTIASEEKIIPTAASAVEAPEPAQKVMPEFAEQVGLPDMTESSPFTNLLFSLIPVALVIFLIVIFRQISRSRRWR